MKKSFRYTSLIAATCVAGLAPQVNAATLTNNGFDWLHSQNNGLIGGENLAHDISVFAGSAGYAGSDGAGAATSGTFGDGTVEAYKFFVAGQGGDGTWGDGNETLDTLTSAGTSITGTVSAGTSIAGNNSAADIWESTNPTGFTTTADYTNPTGVSGISHVDFATLETSPVWSGSIDISSYSSGSIYFLYGHYRGGGAVQDLDLTMKDADLIVGDIQLLNAGSTDTPNNWEQYVVEIGFENDLGYDTIDYALTFDSTQNPNGRIEGIVLDGVAIPEPSSLALLGLSGLALLLRRLRR